jgi:type IV pilus assembly protein PilB
MWVSMTLPRIRIGQLLVDAGLVSRDVVDAVLEQQKADGRRIGALLVERGHVDESQLTQILSHQLSVPWVSLLHIEFSRKLLDLVPREHAERWCLIPIYVRRLRGQGDTLYVAMDDPTNEDALTACASFSGLPVRAMIAPPSDIRAAIRAYYGGVQAPRPEPSAPARPSPFDGVRERATERHSRASAPPPAGAPASRRSSPTPAPGGERAARRSSPPAERSSDAPPSPRRAAVSSEPPPSGRRAPGSRDEDPVIEHTVIDIPAPRGGRAARMVSLTLLDGTTISLPARQAAPAGEEAAPAPTAAHREEVITARDLVAALRAVAHGADGSELLGGDVRWEALFAALLSLLLKKKLIADWELVDELRKV